MRRRMAFPWTLDQPQSLQTRMPVLADDDVVVHGDAERGGDIDDRLGHLDVGLRGRRIAGRVIVQKYSLRIYRIDLKGIFLDPRNRWGMSLGSVVGDLT
jgi:hypothetical protein